MQTAFAYARVSTKDQELKDNSLPAQFKRIEEYCANNNIKIIRRYFDSESAFNDKKRVEFYRMIDEAVQEYPTYIITDDSSRFARQKNIAVQVKNKLREHGINVRFANEPYIDPNTIAGLWNEGIQELINQTSSMQTAFHVTKGMSYNIQNRDQETGWCYKNGGVAPFGYITKRLLKGEDSKGKKILKAIWLIDKEKAQIVREIVIDMRVIKKMSYAEIRDELNKRNIKTNRGNSWTTASVVEFFKEPRLMQYAGYGVWNKTNTKVKSKKYKDKENWIIVENAHEPIITIEEMNKIMEIQKFNKKGAPTGRTRGSKFLFTGVNFEKLPIFICSKCGGNMVGDQNHQAKYFKYVCGNHKNKGNSICDNAIRIKRDWLENMILNEIESKFSKPEKIDKMIQNINNNVSKKNNTLDQEIEKHNKSIKQIDSQIVNLVTAIKNGVDSSIMKEEINKLNIQKENIKNRIKELQNSYSPKNEVTEEELVNFLSDFKTIFNNADMEQKRQLIRTFVRHIIFNPKSEEITIEFYQESMVQTLGKGEPYHK